MRPLIYTIFCFFLIASSSFAVPYLQLGITDSSATYDTNTDTTVSNSDTFTLRAYMNGESSKFESFDEFYRISAALIPNDKDWDGETEFNLGSFTFEGISYEVNADMEFGTPPVEAAENNPDTLAPHSVFPTFFLEEKFKFNENETTAAVNVEPNNLDPDNEPDPTSGLLYFADFDIDVSNLADGYQIHFDLYNLNADGTLKYFAPFSHDAESSGGGGDSPVPEPATLMLMGFGLIGLASLGRKKKA